jgi:hypothetical protein
MTQAQTKQELAGVVNKAISEGNTSDSALLVLFGRIMQAASDGVMSYSEARALTHRFGDDFIDRNGDAIDIAISGLNGSQLDQMAAA